MSGFKRVSPTAHFTGAVWRSSGLSPAELHPLPQRLLARAMTQMGGLSRYLLLEDMLRARHLAMDACLARAIASGAVSQVIELAAGHSARGLRMKQRFGAALHYIETDLELMRDAKLRLLQRAQLLSPGHELRVVDAAKTSGCDSLPALLAELDDTRGTAIITEGLLNYLPGSAVDGLWQTAAAGLRRFPASLYLSDVYLARDNSDLPTRAFVRLLSVAVRGRVSLHFNDPESLIERAGRAGWCGAEVWPCTTSDVPLPLARAPGAQRVRLFAASAHSQIPGAC